MNKQELKNKINQIELSHLKTKSLCEDLLDLIFNKVISDWKRYNIISKQVYISNDNIICLSLEIESNEYAIEELDDYFFYYKSQNGIMNISTSHLTEEYTRREQSLTLKEIKSKFSV